MVKKRSTLKVFDKHPSSSVVFRELANEPVAVGIRDLQGCTSLIIASPTAVYFAHFFEDQGFVAPDDEPDMKEPKMRRIFKQRVIDRLVKGKNGGALNERFQSLTGVSQHFQSDDTHAILMTPFDLYDDPDDAMDKSTAAYQHRVGLIKETVMKLIKLPEDRWHQVLYSGMGIDQPDEYSKGAGRALVEYNPGVGVGSKLKLYVENRKILEM
ncbi:hypothetical protein O1611_g8095 [Lasiodiplodia mahajangana]|uniref:Uncharacterized protein n=1 Tax=Lasiodiplodia mahajangana TaxID=1108764 RepID=A0ACC2JEA6_9PEZI|nr:hypothetical protein O1611_g8095 [Lasiodiplodia mahajangana]